MREHEPIKEGQRWILFIGFEAGEQVSLHEDYGTAVSWLYEWVKEQWVEQGFEEEELPGPEDRAEAIDFFFQECDDGWYYLWAHDTVKKGTLCPSPSMTSTTVPAGRTG